MNTELTDILKRIKENGSYLFEPRKWDIDEDQLKTLISKNKIQSLSDCGIKSMNSEYIYVLYTNPNNFSVKES